MADVLPGGARSSDATQLSGLGVDAAIAAATTVIASLGFRASYGGTVWLLPVIVGIVAGLAAAAAGRLLRWPGLVTAAAGVAIFLLLGPLAAQRGAALGGVLPTPSTMGAVVDGSLRGWRVLLTTAPPVGDVGHLLAIPYACAFWASFLGLCASGSRRLGVLAPLPAYVVLGATVFVGTASPVDLLVEGGALTAISLWSLHHLEIVHQRVTFGRSSRPNLAGAAAMLACVVLLGATVGSHLPGASGKTRYVEREHIIPPFDPSQYPSPLVAFRNYRWHKTAPNGEQRGVDPNSVADDVVFTVSGAPAGAPIRIAVMNAYDDVVWRLSSGQPDDAFRFAGSNFNTRVEKGTTFRATVKIGALSGPWLPLAGDAASVAFRGTDATRLRRDLRYNARMQAAVVVSGVDRNDSYTTTGTYYPPPSATALASASVSDGLPNEPAIPKQLTDEIDNLLAPTDVANSNRSGPLPTSPGAVAQKLSDLLQRTGHLSDGDQANGAKPGHFFARLVDFLSPADKPVPYGDDEQYAAALALMLHAKGIPARVVLGIPHAASGTTAYKGSDVHAWVEVNFDKYGWVAFNPTATNTTPPPPRTLPKPKDTSKLPPNPPPVPPRSSPVEADSQSKSRPGPPRPPHKHHAAANGWLPVLEIAAIPLIVFALPVVLILGLKQRRRRRRRNAVSPTDRIAGAWNEMVDLLRDLGRPVPTTATRRELALATGGEECVHFAATVDGSLFGVDEPVDTDSDHSWASLRTVHDALTRDLGFIARARARLSVTSLRTRG